MWIKDIMHRIINFILFYVGWFLCVFYHSFNIGLIVLSLALINILICKYNFKEIFLIFLLAGVGFFNDMIAASCKVFEFTYSSSSFEWSNIWMFSLWVMFLTTFNSSLAFLNKYNLVIISVCGAISGSISYYASLKIGVINTDDVHKTIIYFVINWAIIFPLLYRIYFKSIAPTT